MEDLVTEDERVSILFIAMMKQIYG